MYLITQFHETDTTFSLLLQHWKMVFNWVYVYVRFVNCIYAHIDLFKTFILVLQTLACCCSIICISCCNKCKKCLWMEVELWDLWKSINYQFEKDLLLYFPCNFLKEWLYICVLLEPLIYCKQKNNNNIYHSNCIPCSIKNKFKFRFSLSAFRSVSPDQVVLLKHGAIRNLLKLPLPHLVSN